MSVIKVKNKNGQFVDIPVIQGPQGETGLIGPQGEQGIQGEKGDKGDTGESGATFTPSVSTDGDLSWTNDKSLPNPATINIKGDKGDKGEKGDTGATGPQGPQGEKGDTGNTGDNGATFTPSVASNGDLSWTNDKNLPNPITVNIKGNKGDKGDKGDTGETGATGPQGPQGETGPQGPAGQDGASVSVVQATDESTAISLSTQNPGSIYYWSE